MHIMSFSRYIVHRSIYIVLWLDRYISHYDPFYDLIYYRNGFHFCGFYRCVNAGDLLKIRAQLFKTNDVVKERIVKTLIIKYGIYINIFAEKNVSSFCICKSYSHFSAKIPVN